MDDLIRTLANARRVEAEHKAELQQVNDEAAALIQERYGDRLKEIGANLAHSQALTQEIGAIIRLAALDSYSESGDKHPHAAVTVKVYRKLGYDAGEAFRYCVDNLTAALQVDKRKFERVAKVAELEFVIFSHEPRATIKRDLSAYL